LVGKEYWGPLLEWVDEVLVKKLKTVAPKETKIYELVNTAEEAFKLIENSQDRSFF
jgi:predicted Rossmann-fold nucleotide-binding protein